MSRKPIDDKTVNAVAALYPSLKSGVKIARKLGLTLATTYRAIHRAGIDLPGRHSPELQEQKRVLKGEREARAVADYVSGVNLQDLIHRYGVSDGTIRSAVKRAGHPLRPRGSQPRKFSAEEQADIIRLYRDEGWSQQAIAAKIDSTQRAVSEFIRAQGLQKDWNARAKHSNWKGGRILNDQGYMRVLLPAGDPFWAMRDSAGYVLEHRIVMARFLGRPLTKHETVHHIDGNKERNVIENLQLRQGKHGNGVIMVCADCGSHNIVHRMLD